jgi:hypothetical protein
VIKLRNLGSTPASDNPILVGVSGAGHRSPPLNAGAGAPYFAAHVPSMPGGGALQWVLTTGGRAAPDARPYALIGRRSYTSPAMPTPLPAISVVAVRGPLALDRNRHRLTVRVRNESSIPQYQLPVYAIEARDGRPVAAGSAIVGYLASNSSSVLNVTLRGNTTGGRLELEAPATIYQ